MRTNILAVMLILLAALWRVAIVYQPALSNDTPVTALAFCGAAYSRDGWLWLVPFAAITLSDLWLNHYYATRFGYTSPFSEMLLRAVGVAGALGIGWVVSRRRNIVNLPAGTLGSAVLFYLTMNTFAWFGDAYYAKTAAGWW